VKRGIEGFRLKSFEGMDVGQQPAGNEGSWVGVSTESLMGLSMFEE
jgi:hypothetical protein